jgi:3-phenylpropionate/trans-cinnamate dioxygenase ferredoxin reductase subunit
MTSTDRTVVVGTGVAGVSAAAAMRASGYEGSIHLVGDEPGLPYRRPPVSKEILRGEKSADEIHIKKSEWFDDKAITLVPGRTVLAVHPPRRVVDLDDGSSLGFDRLLLTTGGRARSPWDAAGVRTLRSLADVPDLAGALGRGTPLVIVGAGLIGSEIAASARDAGCDVTLLEAAPLPMPRLLPRLLGETCAELHRAHGTDLHTDVSVVSVDDGPDGTTVHAADGRSWTAPVVVVAVGMQPRTELAEAAGIALAPAADGGGILVDEHGRTSVEGVFAAGDVANQPRPVLGGRHRVEHWQGAQNHGTAVGRVMAGGDEAFEEVPWCWSDQYGLTLQVAGWPDAAHEVVVHGSLHERDFTAYLLDDGVVRGVVSIGRPREVRAARQWIGAGARLDDMIGEDATS